MEDSDSINEVLPQATTETVYIKEGSKEYDSIIRFLEQNDIYISDYTTQTSDDNGIIWMIILLFFLPLTAAVIYLLFSGSGSWQKGVFPPRLKYNKKNLFDAYIVLGIHLMRQDVSDFQQQVNYFRTYLKNKFTHGQDHSMSHLMNLMKLGVSLESTLTWLNKRMPVDERIQIIDFLADLAFHDHQASSKEIALINMVAKALGVDAQELSAVLSIRFNRYQRRQQQRSTVRSTSSTNKFAQALQTLGLEEAKDLDDVKQAYRKLARKLHPDRFVRMSEEEQQMAHERFTEINLAYEYLQQHFGG